MRKKLTRFHKIEKWRHAERKKVGKYLGDNRKAARAEIASRIEREAMTRAFRQMGAKSRAEQQAKAAKLEEAKFQALWEWKGKDLIDEYKSEKLARARAREWAGRTTIRKISSAHRQKLVPEYRLIRGGKNRGAYQKIQVEVSKVKSGPRKGTEITREIKIGKPVRPDLMRRRLRDAGRRARLTALKNALGLSSLREAKRLDRLMLEVPDRLRKKIYQEVVRVFEEKDKVDRIMKGKPRGGRKVIAKHVGKGRSGKQ